MNLPDHRAGFFTEKIGVDRMFRHQLGDKRLLTGTAQVVSAGELHREEAFSQAFPERRVAVFVNHAAHFRHHLMVEAIAKGSHK